MNTEPTTPPPASPLLPASFCLQTFLYNSGLEFRWLLGKLGYDKWDSDLRAFQLNALLAAEVKRCEDLWKAARRENPNV